MKLASQIILIAGMLAMAHASCPNACSGHGTCGSNDACSCFANYMGADCSDRVCPFGLAFVDTPLGDLNHDGAVEASVSYPSGGLSFATETERQSYLLDAPMGVYQVQWHNKLVNEYFPMHAGASEGYIPGPSGSLLGGYQAQDNEAHFYKECSGKGTCSRSTGECQCYAGYTGGACQRTSCPNDCSGHGVCMTLREIAEGLPGVSTGRNYNPVDYYKTYTVYEGVGAKFEYNLWDAEKNQACVCDEGYSGPSCSQRECPRGNDPLTNEKYHCGNEDCTSEIQALYIKNNVGSDNPVKVRLGYVDVYGDQSITLYSQPFILHPDLPAETYKNQIQEALTTFPNNVLGGVEVTVNAFQRSGSLLTTPYVHMTDLDTDGDVLELKLDFRYGPQGNVNGISINRVETPSSPAVQYGSVAANSAGARAAVTGTGALNSATVFATIGNQLLPKNGNTENTPCSNRGICDATSGLCTCFAGYTGAACDRQNALAA